MTMSSDYRGEKPPQPGCSNLLKEGLPLDYHIHLVFLYALSPSLEQMLPVLCNIGG